MQLLKTIFIFLVFNFSLYAQETATQQALPFLNKFYSEQEQKEKKDKEKEELENQTTWRDSKKGKEIIAEQERKKEREQAEAKKLEQMNFFERQKYLRDKKKRENEEDQKRKGKIFNSVDF